MLCQIGLSKVNISYFANFEPTSPYFNLVHRIGTTVNYIHPPLRSTTFMTVRCDHCCNRMVYGVFVSHLICYARVCSKYEDFLFRSSILVSNLLKQAYSSRKLQTIFRKCYAKIIVQIVHNLDTSVSHMLNGLFTNWHMTGYQLFE